MMHLSTTFSGHTTAKNARGYLRGVIPALIVLYGGIGRLHCDKWHHDYFRVATSEVESGASKAEHAEVPA